IVAGRVDLWWEAVPRPNWSSEIVESLLSRVSHGDAVVQLLSTGGILGGNCAFRRAVHETIGGFREDLGRTGKGLGAAEETEFFGRALQAGFRAWYAPGASIKHWVAPQRLTTEYLVKAAAGRGRSQVLMKPDLGPA